ncbi:hypothetical protein PV08_02245 [Exophiala spinifera]|uniref:Uncharacterized protein n=1 Tax=Exophiala spinifera TaxID=91928 RepID=A0A0D2BTC7_9EURO|nr:uncharacterized protein PV08_02245 [Exophiala spinifera]KIW21665.1 hypothetical protein PV08_02245 [Exophiala spinifera]
MRNELSALQGLRALERKKVLTNRIYRHLQARPAEFWKWTHLGKARSVFDMFGRSAVMALPAVRGLDADAQDLLDARSQFIQEVEMLKPERGFNTRKGLESLHEQLKEVPSLGNMLNMWEGRVVKLASLYEIEATQRQESFA